MLKPARIAVLTILTAFVWGPVATVASAQSDSELRRENTQLKEQVRDLENQLDDANSRIADLEAQIASLQRALAAARSGSATTPDPKPDKVTIDESEPDASPRALFRAVKESYQENIGDMNAGAPNSRERRGFLRALDQWSAAVGREFRNQITWHVRVIDQQQSNRAVTLNLVAVDPETGTELGNPFSVLLTSRQFERMQALGGRINADTWVLRGIVSPDVVIDETYSAPGPFDDYRFVGRFVEFSFDVNVKSITPAAHEPDEEDGDDQS